MKPRAAGRAAKPSSAVPKIFVMIPTYNEKDNIGPLIQAIETLSIADLHLVVVDDNSPDGTGEILDRLAKTRPRLHVLHRMHERGRGSAGIAGFKHALKLGAGMVVEMDADFSHHPRHLPN